MTEADLYKPVMLALTHKGCRVFRNHVGLHGDGQARFSAGLAKGSSDLIGIAPDGRFLSIELKRPGWKPTPKWRASQQAKWIAMVQKQGGIAGTATSVEEAISLLEDTSATRDHRKSSHDGAHSPAA